MNRTEYLRDLGSTAGARAGEAVLHLGPIERQAEQPQRAGSRRFSPCSPAPHSWGRGVWSWPCRKMCPLPPLYSHSIQPTARGCAKVVLRRGEGPREEAQDAMCKHAGSLYSCPVPPKSKCEQPRENHCVRENPQHPDKGRSGRAIWTRTVPRDFRHTRQEWWDQSLVGELRSHMPQHDRKNKQSKLSCDSLGCKESDTTERLN